MMHIRQATIDDSPAIAKVQVDSYRAAYAPILPQDYLERFTYEEQFQDWRDLISSNAIDVLNVAVLDIGEIVGYALGKRGPSGIAPYDSELVALHVRESYQLQGIGRSLVAATAAWLRQEGCAALMLWVLAENPARGFYEHLGGKQIGQKSITLGNDVSASEVAYGWSSIDTLCP